VVVVGLSHRRAPLVLRESLAFPPYDLETALAALKGYVPEGAILSTCHRVEVYAAAPDAARAKREIKRFLVEQRGVPLWEFEPHLYSLEDGKAVEHLFLVAGGLDSAIVGEPQILGQVREALRQGLDHRSVGRVLSTLLRQAVTVGKRARTETGIGRNAISTSYAAVELARRTVGDLRSSHVLLVGAGKMGELAAKNIMDKGVAGLAVVGRTSQRAERLAQECGGAVTSCQLEEALPHSDIVISCTSAPHHVIPREMVEKAMRARHRRPLVLIDIALPRDIDPSVAEIPSVRLYNVDDLESAVAANMKERRAEARKVAPIIRQEVATFERWLATQRVVPTIAALRRRADAIRQAELKRVSAVLDRLPESDRQRIEALTLAMAKKLLHDPIALLKARAAEGDGLEAAEALQELFDLDLRERRSEPDGGDLTDSAEELLPNPEYP
jgi:glutamyl-tRNA reductase